MFIDNLTYESTMLGIYILWKTSSGDGTDRMHDVSKCLEIRTGQLGRVWINNNGKKIKEQDREHKIFPGK